MSDPLEGTNEKPSLLHLQFLQDNWDRDAVASAERISKVIIATGGDAGVDASIPVGAEIVDAHVVCTRTNGSGTLQVQDGNSNAVTDAIDCSTAGAIDRATTMDDDYTRVTADGIQVVANAWNDGGICYIHYIMP